MLYDERSKDVLKDDVQVLSAIIHFFESNPGMDQIQFATIMSEAFGGVCADIRYQFDIAWQRHTIRCRDRPEAAP